VMKLRSTGCEQPTSSSSFQQTFEQSPVNFCEFLAGLILGQIAVILAYALPDFLNSLR
jgi:hypothetical protein